MKNLNVNENFLNLIKKGTIKLCSFGLAGLMALTPVTGVAKETAKPTAAPTKVEQNKETIVMGAGEYLDINDPEYKEVLKEEKLLNFTLDKDGFPIYHEKEYENAYINLDKVETFVLHDLDTDKYTLVFAQEGDIILDLPTFQILGILKDSKVRFFDKNLVIGPSKNIELRPFNEELVYLEDSDLLTLWVRYVRVARNNQLLDGSTPILMTVDILKTFPKKYVPDYKKFLEDNFSKELEKT